MGSPRRFQSAAAIVDSDAVTPVYRSQRGFGSAAITRTGAGDYTLTLDKAYDSNTTKALISTHGALSVGDVEWASSTTLRCRTFTLVAGGAGVCTITAADIDFTVEIGEMGPA